MLHAVMIHYTREFQYFHNNDKHIAFNGIISIGPLSAIKKENMLQNRNHFSEKPPN